MKDEPVSQRIGEWWVMNYRLLLFVHKEAKMRTRGILVGLVMLAAVVLSVGCGGMAAPAATAPTATPAADKEPVVAKSGDTVIAEGVIEPARFSEMHFEIGGEVTEVLVVEGDQVSAGTPLLRLDIRELELSLQSAEQDVIAQRAALDRVIVGASDTLVARAAKENAEQIAQAEVALRASELQLERTRAEDPAAQVEAAQARIEQLRLQLAQTRAQDPAPDVTAAQVELERAKIALDDTQDEYNKALDRPWEDQEIRDSWAKQLEQAKLNYRSAQAQLDRASNARRAHAISLDALAAQIEEAGTQLTQATAAQEAYATTLEILAADIESAQLQLEALRTWENPYLDKATEEEVAQAEARLRQAELAVARLALQLEDVELRAPFDGTVVDVRVETGDQVSPGQAVIVMATLDQLQVRTVDLTELDVARVTVGQPAVVSVDALPGQEFDGVVQEIALQAGDYRGDVVYAVIVELADVADAPLRWGMTALVKIEAP
jgi:multidrug resistance efflux pump